MDWLLGTLSQGAFTSPSHTAKSWRARPKHYSDADVPRWPIPSRCSINMYCVGFWVNITGKQKKAIKLWFAKETKKGFLIIIAYFSEYKES